MSPHNVSVSRGAVVAGGRSWDAAEKTPIRMGFEFSGELRTCGGQGLEDSGRMKVGSYQL